MTYPEWLRACDRECIRLTGLDLDSVCGDTETRDAYEGGVTPAAHVAEAIANSDFPPPEAEAQAQAQAQAWFDRQAFGSKLSPPEPEGRRPIPPITENYKRTPSDWRTNPPDHWTPRPRLPLEEA